LIALELPRLRWPDLACLVSWPVFDTPKVFYLIETYGYFAPSSSDFGKRLRVASAGGFASQVENKEKLMRASTSII
jgi:hypothetical protein